MILTERMPNACYTVVVTSGHLLFQHFVNRHCNDYSANLHLSVAKAPSACGGHRKTYHICQHVSKFSRSANNNNKLKYCSETEEACVNNADCLGASNKCEEGSNSWGLFEIELPIVVPHVCWNTGMNTGAHKRCKDKLGGGTDQPAQTTWKMYTRPTSNNDGLNCRRASVVITPQPTPAGGFSPNDDIDVWDSSGCLAEPTPTPTMSTTTPP